MIELTVNTQAGSSITRTFGKIALGSVLALSSLGISTVSAGLDAEIGLEARVFVEDGFAEQEAFQPSVRADLEYDQDLLGGEFVAKVFGRYDVEDQERTHADVREALWTYVGDEYELKMGIGKVFWGVTESRHLVDVINQTDAVENPDGEDKLGQAMMKLSLEKDWGTVDLFWLPHFRERTFASIEDGRLPALPAQVVFSGLRFDPDQAQYESSAEQWRSDVAFRYSHYIDELEFAVSHFSGTSRDPSASPILVNGSVLAPYYATVDQTGIELQYIYEEWLWKFEGITNSGVDNGKRYSAAVAGFEYTQVGIFDSAADLGWLVEYLFDDRKNNAPHFFERDIFAGWRYALNDEDSSEILTGFIYDPKTEELMFSFEANKRLASDLKLNFEARVFSNAETDRSLKTFLLKDEDFIQLELVKYF